MIRLFEGAAIAEAYALFRPQTPPEVATIAMKYFNSRFNREPNVKQELLLDVGCGSGQSTSIFSPYFSSIIGLDPSPGQIDVAIKENKHDNITFKVATAENLPVKNKSVNMMACGQSVHWFDFPAFFRECNRVLKPNGCLVLHGYDTPSVFPIQISSNRSTSDLKASATELLTKLYNTCDFNPRRKHIDDHYSEIFGLIVSKHKTKDESIEMKKFCTLHDFICYLTTWSGYRSYMEKVQDELRATHENVTEEIVLKHDILYQFLKTLQKDWEIQNLNPKAVNVCVAWNSFMILSERPNPINK